MKLALLNRHKINEPGRDFFVGDIHGCVPALWTELSRVDFDVCIDRLFAVGDLIDRGPESRTALDLLGKPWFFSVIGNHEDFLLSHGPQNDMTWMANGGQWAFDGWERAHDIDCYRAWVADRCPIAIEVETRAGRIGVIHTDPPDNWDMLEAYHQKQYLWGRSRMRAEDRSDVLGIDAVVYGHTPVREPHRLGNTLNIDTGACFHGGRLTVLSAEQVLETTKAPEGAL